MDCASHVLKGKLAWWFLLPGIVFICGTAGLAARLIWEMTALSWSSGPQMVGFALAHGHGPSFLLIFPILLLIWLVLAVPYLGWIIWKSRSVTSTSLQTLICAIVLFVILALPQGFWIRLFISRFASGPYAAEFMINAAATGDLSTVKAMIAHGVPVDARDRENKTALHGAAVEGDVTAIEFLLKNGANINAVSLWGDSPLENATSMGRADAVKYLEGHGGIRIRGSDEHRKIAAHAIAQEDIERLEREHPELNLPKGQP